MEILETQERKMNKNKEKKRELTHFLGHYLTVALCLAYNYAEIYLRNALYTKNPSTLQESNIDGFLFFSEFNKDITTLFSLVFLFLTSCTTLF